MYSRYTTARRSLPHYLFSPHFLLCSSNAQSLFLGPLRVCVLALPLPHVYTLLTPLSSYSHNRSRNPHFVPCSPLVVCVWRPLCHSLYCVSPHPHTPVCLTCIADAWNCITSLASSLYPCNTKPAIKDRLLCIRTQFSRCNATKLRPKSGSDWRHVTVSRVPTAPLPPRRFFPPLPSSNPPHQR